MSQPELTGVVVLITGAGRPPAPALARSLAAAGAVVALNDLSPTLVDPVITAIQRQGGQARAYIADATRGMPLRAMLDEVLADWERIDVLINNPRIQPHSELLAMDEWDWQRTIEMNLNGPFLATQLAARLMREQGGGAILQIIDQNPSALEAPGRGAYAASQHGLLAMARAAAREFIAYNIRVHALCPEASILAAQDDAAAQGSEHDAGSQEALNRLVRYLCAPAATGARHEYRIAGGQVLPALPGLKQDPAVDDGLEE